MPSAFNYDPTVNLSVGCKLYNYFAYGMDALSPWCLVYISFERFIATKYYAKRFLYKKKMYQIIFLILLFLFNISYHINIIFSFDILTIDDNSTLCYFNNDQNQIIVANMDLTNFFLLPFTLMFLFSICLIISIFKARSSVNLNNTAKETRRRKKNIKLSISLLLMNLLFLLLNLPIVVSQYLPFDSDIYTIVSNIYYIPYAVNFYILLFTNSLFRNVFYCLFYEEKQKLRKNLELNKNQVNSNQNNQNNLK